MAISGEPSPEVGEPPGSDEEEAVTMDISGEPGPEVGEPPTAWPPLFTSSFALSGKPLSPSARGGGSSTKRYSSASDVSPTASSKNNKAAPSIRSRSQKTKKVSRREATQETKCVSLAFYFISIIY
jgi:hypothetical protein